LDGVKTVKHKSFWRRLANIVLIKPLPLLFCSYQNELRTQLI
jgi:hypothetical protein